ncbi:uncharacterized protein AB675_9994 [Cyphellophora attinorum]|uniref:Uncharacterized protein n=1 Tax=Cyphellophora attinorum TaxID=1664694 RepID=A0A0N1H503_9EURO|nr:uncharacterized protein AB675_9994 [Phialophora attinorum]KPI36647.1 hypothetical protein AB675_9994 [Phialophora attinorum]
MDEKDVTMIDASSDVRLTPPPQPAAPAVPEHDDHSPADSDIEGGKHHAHHHHHPHLPHHLRSRHLNSFIHPHHGRHCHVVKTPDELERKRLELSATFSQEQFDVVLHGSPDHIDAIRGLHAQSEAERDALHRDHAEVAKQFENVRDQLELLDNELHMLTDHSVALDASFDKFGYSAHLRTTDKDSGDTASLSSSNQEEKHKDRSTDPLKFFKRPQVRQYFHKGLLWRSSRHGEVESFELFVDLVYVGVIDIIGEKAAEAPSGLALLQFVIIFCIAWKIWSDMTYIINSFHIGDIFQRICVAFYLICLFGFTTNIWYSFPEGHSAETAQVEAAEPHKRAEAEGAIEGAASDYHNTYISAIAFFVAQRAFVGIWYLGVAVLVPMIKGSMVSNTLIILISSALWIGSIHVSWPNQLALIFLGIAIDLMGGMLIIALWRRIKNPKHSFWARMQKWFDFVPAINIEHRVERNNAFIALVFGYSILTILYQSSASMGINAFFGKGVLGLLQAFCFNWIYFEIDNYGIHVHAIRRHWATSAIWVTGHLPFIMAYILAASSLTTLVLAHDCPDAEPEWLGSHYADRSLPELSSGTRWFYCGGIGIALLFMGIISLSHTHKRLQHSRLKKRPRLFYRLIASIVIIVLPTAGNRLSSLDLVAITFSIVLSVLIVDLYGNSAQGTPFWTHGLCPKERKQTTYVATCKLSRRRRRELQKRVKKGEDVSLGDVLRLRDRAGSESTLNTLNSSEGSLGGKTVGDEEKGEPRRRAKEVHHEDWHGGTY